MSGFPSRSSKTIAGFQKALYDRQDLLGYIGANQDNSWWVDPTNGSDSHDGNTRGTAFASLTKAITKVKTGHFVFMLPGRYDETAVVTIARTDAAGTALSNVTLIGVGGRGAIYVDPTTEDQAGMIIHADDVTLINVGVAAEDSTSGNYSLVITGSRFRAYGCKIEAGEDQVRIGPGTVVQEAAGTHGVGADWLFEDCEFAWGTNGINLVCTDYGAVTQGFVQGCRFHNLTAKHIKETVGSGGSAAVTFQNIQIWGNFFDDLDDGTAPTNYIDLNGDNANTGVVGGNWFPTAINSALNLVSTAMHWVCNYHTGGISTGQPS